MRFLLNFFILLNIFSIITMKCYDDDAYGAACINNQNSVVYEGYEGKNYMENYFYNLHNFTTNISESCAFNAINILLDYYDSFWDDDLIPEKYDYNVQNKYEELGYTNSPSSTFQKFDNIKTETANIFYSYLDDNNFMKYLIKAAMECGLVGDLKPFGDLKLKYSEIVELIHFYLEKYTSSKCDFYEIGYDIYRHENMHEFDNYLTNSQFLENETIKLINKGIPVILLLGNDSGVGHAVVAYDYDEVTDKLYCHSGYDNKTHYWYKEDYVFIRGMYAITPVTSDSHRHSNNYLDYNRNSYCSCKLLTHEHNFEGISLKNFTMFIVFADTIIMAIIL